MLPRRASFNHQARCVERLCSTQALIRKQKTAAVAKNINTLRRWIFPACDVLHIKRASWLTFRRTYSSWAHDKGVPAKIVAQLMGHAKVDTTLNVYTQVLDNSVRAAASRIGAELFTIVHTPEGIDPVSH